jgi:hypothetical protein
MAGSSESWHWQAEDVAEKDTVSLRLHFLLERRDASCSCCDKCRELFINMVRQSVRPDDTGSVESYCACTASMGES